MLNIQSDTQGGAGTAERTSQDIHAVVVALLQRGPAPTLNGSRSALNMWCSCVRQPLSVRNAAMQSAEPSVKHSANLAGARMMTGRNTENASTRNTTPAANIAKKYVNCVLDGICTLRFATNLINCGAALNAGTSQYQDCFLAVI